MSTALAEVDDTIVERPTDNPLAILQQALERGTDPAKLEKLMDLAERWKAERAAEEFATSLNEAQKAMPCVVRDKANDFLKTRYATLENVNSVIKPVYTQHGFSLSYGTEDSKLDGCMRIVCDVSHVGGCTRRYHLDCPVDGAGMKGGSNKSGMQAMGSTISYGRRYLALMIFNVTVADQDIDGNNAAILDAITDEQALAIEDLIEDKKVNRAKFLEWLAAGNHFVGEDRLITSIRAKSFAHVIDMLNRKKAGAK